MLKLSQYVDMAAREYLLETGGVDDLNPRWSAEFFQDSGLLDDYPRQDLVAFHALVQKALTKQSERAGKQAHAHVEKIIRFANPRRKT